MLLHSLGFPCSGIWNPLTPRVGVSSSPSNAPAALNGSSSVMLVATKVSFNGKFHLRFQYVKL
jgi:hypothetical protein